MRRNLLLNEAGQLKITGFGRLVRRCLYIESPEGTEIGSCKTLFAVSWWQLPSHIISVYTYFSLIQVFNLD